MKPTSPAPPLLDESGQKDRRFQITLLHLFWWMFVIGALLGYVRLLSDTAGASFASVLLLAAPAIGTALLLIWDPRTWPGPAVICAPVVVYFLVILVIRYDTFQNQHETLFGLLLIGSWIALLGGYAMRLQLTSSVSLIGDGLLLLAVLIAFVCGMPTIT
ncbi:hypothetical protein M4951_06870 [Blastopirellula sp. J2-11]|uniref:hypothetical protein n=1 Tax=Blastopirellula sp. J2-11 TaxID=2943192 RepID=UPI0021C8FFE0|nr:hypothetical protein [Blastopirellula sp. J2-11]UUO08033.1 hypothetical protein M4951_06870 [Blastopirellula sp. J2-11]